MECSVWIESNRIESDRIGSGIDYLPLKTLFSLKMNELEIEMRNFERERIYRIYRILVFIFFYFFLPIIKVNGKISAAN